MPFVVCTVMPASATGLHVPYCAARGENIMGRSTKLSRAFSAAGSSVRAYEYWLVVSYMTQGGYIRESRAGYTPAQSKQFAERLFRQRRR